MTIDDIIKGLIDREGRVYTESEHDPPTKFGITLGDWAEYTGRPAFKADIQNLREVEDAYPFFWRRYIIAPGFDQIADEWLQVFMVDTAVLEGIKTAVKMLQRMLNVPADGVFGPETQGALAQFQHRAALKKWLLTQRMHHLIGCALNDPKLPREYLTATDLEFLHGWWNRVASFI